MYKKILILLIVFPIFIIFFGGLINREAKAEDCKLLAGLWDKDNEAITVGQTRNMLISGQNCEGRDITIKIKEEDTFSNDLIIQKSVYFSNPSSLIVSHTFTAKDYETGGNESGTEGLFFEAFEAINPNNKITSSVVEFRSGNSSQNCQITSARWDKDFSSPAILGSEMKLVVEGINCKGAPLLITIWEEDSMAEDDSMDVKNFNFGEDENKYIYTWKISERMRYLDDDDYGSYFFYFIAKSKNSEVRSEPLQIPLHSETGCVNCNAVAYPDTCECNDGYAGNKPALQSCDSVCKNHTGDALGKKENKEGRGSGDMVSIENDYGVSPPPGVPLTLEGFADMVAKTLFEIAVPVAILLIIIGGIMMLVSGGRPDMTTKAKNIIRYAIYGLTIILVGRGFIYLIKSLLESL